MVDITETSEYKLGWEWAKEHGPHLAELFTSKEVATPELRVLLFKEAARRWPSQRDSMDNDLKQTAFVAGAIKSAVESLPLTEHTGAAIFEASLEMGIIWSTERAKAKAIEELKKKPRGWWQRKFGDARPNDVVGALSVAWRYEWAKERGRPHPGSRWAVLIDTLQSRELTILADVVEIRRKGDGDYRQYVVVDSERDTFSILSEPVIHEGRVIGYPGEVVG